MASYARIFIHMILASCLLWAPPVQAQFQLGNFMSVSTISTVEMHEKNHRDAVKAEYLKGFASYVSAMVYAQGLDIKERIACLSKPETILSNPTCYSFVYGDDEEPESEYITLLKAYMEMRKQLALATTNSVSGKVEAGLDRFGVPFQFTRGGRLSHLFDKFRLNFMSSLPAVPALAPLTEVELEGIDQVISVTARATIESYYSSSGMNEIPDLLEDQVAQERAQVQAEFDNSEQSFDDFAKWDAAQRRLDQKVQEQYDEFMSTYRFVSMAGMNREILQGFHDLEKDSKLRYYQLIQQFPVLAFLKLEAPLIERFLETGDFEGTYPAVAEAMSEALTVNESYFAHLQGLQEEGLRQLLPLMEMAPLADQYFDPSIHNEEIIEELKSANEWREIKEDLRTVALGVAWGFTCGAILAWGYGRLVSWGLSAAAALATQSAVSIQCAITSGLALNAIFYVNSNNRYHRTFQQFFAVSTADKRERYQVLQEISQLQQRDQEMLFESLFLFVGTGVGESVRRLLSPASQQTIFRWLQASGRE